MSKKINQNLFYTTSNSTEFIHKNLAKEIISSIYKEQNQETIQQESI